MKKGLLQLTLIGISTAFLSGICQAQDSTSPSAPPDVSSPTSRGSSASTNVISKPATGAAQAGTPTHVTASRMIGSKVKSSTGENVGQIDDVVIDSTGQIQMAVLGVGGFLGIGEKKTPVPWQALKPTATQDFVLNIDRQKLKTAPTVDRNATAAQWATPTFTQQVYAHYGMQPPSAVGATGTGALGTETGREIKEGAKELKEDIKESGKELQEGVERSTEKAKESLEDK